MFSNPLKLRPKGFFLKMHAKFLFLMLEDRFFTEVTVVLGS